MPPLEKQFEHTLRQLAHADPEELAEWGMTDLREQRLAARINRLEWYLAYSALISVSAVLLALVAMVMR